MSSEWRRLALAWLLFQPSAELGFLTRFGEKALLFERENIESDLRSPIAIEELFGRDVMVTSLLFSGLAPGDP